MERNVVIDINKSINYVLSIQVRLDGFSFDIFCTQEKRTLGRKVVNIDSKNYNHNLAKCIQDEELLALNYQRIELTFYSRKYTLVPFEFYDQEEQEMLFRFNQSLEKDETVINQAIYSLNSQLLFSIPIDTYNFLIEHFKGTCVKHPLENIINKTLIIWSNGHIHISLEKDYCDILISQRQELKFINNFKYSSLEDIIYHLTKIVTKLNINRADASVFIQGKQLIAKQLQNAMLPYFKEVEIITISPA